MTRHNACVAAMSSRVWIIISTRNAGAVLLQSMAVTNTSGVLDAERTGLSYPCGAMPLMTTSPQARVDLSDGMARAQAGILCAMTGSWRTICLLEYWSVAEECPTFPYSLSLTYLSPRGL